MILSTESELTEVWVDPTADLPTERRRWRRMRVLKHGKALLNDHSTVLDCTIRDLSQGGARLQIVNATVLPSSFRLSFVTDGTVREVRVVWRRAGEAGVEFQANTA